MNLDIAVLADAATVDAGGKLNILGAFHRLRGRSFPLRHGRLSLVLRFAPEPGDGGKMKVGIRLVGPDDEEVVRLNGEVAHRGGKIPEHARIPQVLNLDGIVFKSPGTYRFQVSVDGNEVGNVPLHVEEASRSDDGPGPGSGGGPTLVMVPPGSEGGVRA